MTAARTGGAFFAPAKLNLTLEILGRRADGYHELESLVVFAGVGDCLEVEAAEELSLELSGPFAAELARAEGENLVLRAARLLAAHAGVEPKARLRLQKNLPLGAGLGGGSSDAAVTLRALAALWGLSLSPQALASLGLSLGADLPVCLYGRSALMRGIGEKLQAAPPVPPLWVVLLNPGESLNTASVYRARRGPFSSGGEWWSRLPQDAAEVASLLAAKRNDLEAPASRLCPSIGSLLSRLAETPGCLLARMSGSGPSCFGLYGSEKEARAAAAQLAKHRPDWWVAAAPLLQETASLGCDEAAGAWQS